MHEVTFSLTGGIPLLPDEQYLSSWAKCWQLYQIYCR